MPVVTDEEALKILRGGDPVALPTETVYGLAAPINNEAAIKKIFAIKSRPFFDPLIVHIAELGHGQLLAKWDKLSTKLAQRFWPGPLTLILPKEPTVSDLITAGGSTVGLRCPLHVKFQSILRQMNVPLAAPSANRFGKVSPTSAQDVLDEFKGMVPVVDGGQSPVGIESTVVEVQARSDGWLLSVLRPGIITPHELAHVAKKAGFQVEIEIESKSHSPGHLKNHYQPDVPLVLIEAAVTWTPATEQVIQQYLQRSGVVKWLQLSPAPEIAARELYGQLRRLDHESPAFICCRYARTWSSEDKWRAIDDRLRKSCTLVVELNDVGETIVHS